MSSLHPENLKPAFINDETDDLNYQESVHKVEARNDLLRQIRVMESIVIKNPDQSINIERTKEERLKVIAEQGLDKITEIDSNYTIIEDESGLPVLEVK